MEWNFVPSFSGTRSCSWNLPLLEEKREHAEKLIKDGYYTDAISVLEALARNRAPRAEEHAYWAREQLPKVKARLKEARKECRDACGLAEQLYADYDYARAVEVLEKFKRGSRSGQAEAVAQRLQAGTEESSPNSTRRSTKRSIIKRRTRTSSLTRSNCSWNLIPKTAGPGNGTRELLEERRKENSLGWRLGLAAMALICLGAVYWIGKLVFFPGGEGTITIKLREPGYSVYGLMVTYSLPANTARNWTATNRASTR